MDLVRALAIGALAIGALAGAGACSKEQPKKALPATPVRVATASRIDAPVDIMASGVVEPMQTVAVTTQVSGTLLDVAVQGRRRRREGTGPVPHRSATAAGGASIRFARPSRATKPRPKPDRRTTSDTGSSPTWAT